MRIIINEQILKENVEVLSLKKAIVDKKVARLSYEDAPGNRMVELDLIGRTKAGNLAIRAFQVSGPTQSQNNDWKIFSVDKILTFSITDQDINENRPKYNPVGDEEFSEIFYKREN